ncbi:hypothetical protein R80B4_03133 [Fibrobacteres bacterium R8-0-B4]
MKSLSKKLRPPLITAAAVFAAVLGGAGSAWATTTDGDSGPAIFSGKHIEITMGDWLDGYIGEKDLLYAEALVKNLDAFVGSLKKKGKLDAEKVVIWHYSGYEFRLERNGGEYYCSFSDSKYFTQNYLAKVIAYLATDTCVDWDSGSDTAAFQKFNAVINKMKVPYTFATRKLKDVGNGFAVYFQGGRLVCKDADSVYYDIDDIPFTIGSKTFISAKKTVYIVENGKVTFKTSGEIRTAVSDKSRFFMIVAPKTIYVVENGEIKHQIEDKFSYVATAFSAASNVYAIAAAKAFYVSENGKAPYKFNEKLNKISKPLVVGSTILIGGRSNTAVGEDIKDYALFYAIEDGKILDKVKLNNKCYDNAYGDEICNYTTFWPKVFPKWVNYNGYDGDFLSYSIEKNKFYKVDKKVEEE